MQLEKIIGKLKTEKYGSKILDEIKKYTDSGSSDNGNEEEGSENRASKRLKTKKGIVIIESSDEEL